jgi:hypothetical protein
LENHTWKLGGDRPMIQIARQLNRDAIFADFYAKCKTATSKKEGLPSASLPDPSTSSG